MSQNATLYVAIVVYQSSASPPTYEESVLVLRAADEEAARSHAEALARTRETTFRNVEGADIAWTLKQVVDVSPCLSDALEDGAEIYSRHFKNYDAYRSFEPMLDGALE